MKRVIFLYFQILVLFSAVVACNDDNDETMSWRPGTGLHIIGPSEANVGEEAEYYVDGFTVNETYTWTLDGAPVTPERQGEFVYLTFDTPGTHTLSVTNGTYSGDISITAE